MADSTLPPIDAASIAKLLRRSYPTNTRELERLLWDALATATDDGVTFVDAISEPAIGEPSDGDGLSIASARAALQKAAWSIAEAAVSLGVHRSTLSRFIKKHGLRPR